MKTAAQQASEYVEAHLPLLNAYSRSTRFRHSDVDPDEFRSDLVNQVLTAHNTFRQINDTKSMLCPYCSRRGCSTWLGWRARKTMSNIIRAERRDARYVVSFHEEHRQANGSDQSHPIDRATDPHNTPEKVFAKVQVKQLFDRATPAQAEALVSKLEEWTGDDVWMELGIGMGGRNYRLKKLMEFADD